MSIECAICEHDARSGHADDCPRKKWNEKPILFSAPMIRALLDGSKTQTRRAIKPVGSDDGFVLYELNDGTWWPYRSDDGESGFHTVTRGGKEYQDETPFKCPYGKPGDRLWVRETWAKHFPEDSDVFYRADRLGVLDYHMTWKPSIHMRREYSRITLQITGVRVARLQDISEADAIAEGISYHKGWEGYCLEDGRFFHCTDPRQSYAGLWESINGAGSWDASPWVWVVEFKRIEANA